MAKIYLPLEEDEVIEVYLAAISELHRYEAYINDIDSHKRRRLPPIHRDDDYVRDYYKERLAILTSMLPRLQKLLPKRKDAIKKRPS